MHEHCEHEHCEQASRCLVEEPGVAIRSPDGRALVMHRECAIQCFSANNNPEQLRMFIVWDECRENAWLN